MSTGGLCLEDCLEDSPQTRALIGVYEQDSTIFLEFIQSLRNSYQEVADIQNQLALATNSLSNKLKQFSNLSFSLNIGVEDLGSTVNKLAVKVDEIAMINKIAHGELIENLNGPHSQFGEQDFDEFYRLKTNFHSSDKLHEDAASRLARVPKKKSNEKSWKEATDQLYAARKAFHNTSMLYCSCLNTLQKKKEIGILQPVISLLKSQISYSVLCEDHRQEWSQSVDDLSVYINKLKTEVDDSRQVSLKSIDCLDAASTRAYIPDPPVSLDFPDIPVNKTLTQISGYLFHRSRGTIMTQWNRYYFFTQGGNLMKQSKDDFGGQLCIDLEGCSIAPFDVDDRKHVFQVINSKKKSRRNKDIQKVVSSNNKHNVVLQAESKHQLEEWIATLSNVSATLLSRRRQEQAVSDSSASATAGEQDQTSNQGGGQKTPSSSSVTDSLASRLKPDSITASGSSMFLRLKQAASSLVSPSEKDSPHNKDSNSKGDAAAASRSAQVANQERLLKNSSSSPSSVGDKNIHALLASNTSISFNLPKIGRLVPTTTTKPNDGQKENSENKSTEEQSEIQGVGTSEVGVSSSPSSDSLKQAAHKASFTSQFLGCKEIQGKNFDNLIIDETIWQIMTARALQKVMNTIEVVVAITDCDVILLNASDQSVLKVFQSSTIAKTQTHAENPRLFGFIVTNDNSESICYTFESFTSGNDVCCAINTAKAIHESKLEYEESEKQKTKEEEAGESTSSQMQAISTSQA